MAVRCLALADAVERLRAPAAEEWSALTGTPVVAIDARAGAPYPDERALADAARRVVTLPCPVVVLASVAPPPALRAFLAAAAVVVTSAEDLAACVTACTEQPLAAATLVQVLRAGVGCSVADALVLESLAYATLQGGPEHARWLATRTDAARPAPAAASPVRVEREGGRLTITLDRPNRHNAFSAAMRDALVEALAVAVAEPALTVVVRGAGPSFCSGGDLEEFGTAPDPATAHLVRTTRSPARILAGLGARVRVELHGACVGAGVELPAFAGRVAARPDARFHLPEIRMGLIPGAGGTVGLPRRIGRQRTAYLALSGRWIDAAEAHAWGLVDAVGDEGTLP